MDDLQEILISHKSKKKSQLNTDSVDGPWKEMGETSEIPNLFFDNILVTMKLGRIEIMVLMYIYRQVWCRPNLYRQYGLSQLLSHTEMAKSLGTYLDEIYTALRNLESFGLISTIRSGQYFIRKYFLKTHDDYLGQSYDDFEV